MGYPLEQCEKWGSLDAVQALLNNSLNNVISTTLVTNWKQTTLTTPVKKVYSTSVRLILIPFTNRQIP